MKKPYPALCKDCKYSKPEDNPWVLRCHNQTVNSKDPYTLAGVNTQGSSCTTERERNWFAPCGMRGRLWEPK